MRAGGDVPLASRKDLDSPYLKLDFDTMVSVSRQNKKAILGKKIGMTQIFTEDGERVPVTVIQAGPCTVLRVKSPEKDGYTAFQLGFDDTNKSRKKPQQAELDRLGVNGKRFVREVPYVDPADVFSEDPGGEADGEGDVVAGSRIGVSVLKEVSLVDIRGLTKGRGFTGVVKRHGFKIGDKAHGSKNMREPGSTGMHTDPGRVFKGKKLAGQHGNQLRKAIGLSVVGIEEEDNVLIVRGSVPGPPGSYLYIEESLKT